MATAGAKGWSWKDLPNWWPVLVAIVAAVYAAAQVNARVAGSEQTNASQDQRIATLERTVSDMAITTGRVDERTKSMQTTLNGMATRQADRNE